jgi:hypothetical protein
MPTTGHFAHQSHFKTMQPRVYRSVRSRTLCHELTLQIVGQLAIKLETAPAITFARAMRGLD